MRGHKWQVFQKRLILSLEYFRVLNRFTANEITESTGINFYQLQSGVRPVTIATMVKLEPLFGSAVVSNLFNHAWQGEGEWKEEALTEHIRLEQAKWDKEKKEHKH